MSKNATPNLTEAHKFLKLLDPLGVFTFQTFDDDAARKDPRLNRVLHGGSMPFRVERDSLI